MSRPRVTLKCVAQAYASPNERIVEVFDAQTRKGCLIAVRRMTDNTLAIDVYRRDPGVLVRFSPPEA